MTVTMVDFFGFFFFTNEIAKKIRKMMARGCED